MCYDVYRAPCESHDNLSEDVADASNQPHSKVDRSEKSDCLARFARFTRRAFSRTALLAVSGKVSSEVTKLPLAESRRLLVTESKLSEYMERKDRKCGER